MYIISKDQLEQAITIPRAIKAVEQAFKACSSGRLISPDPLVFNLQKNEGEICIKTAVSDALPTFCIKQVSVLLKNKNRGLPTLNGTMNIYDRRTGRCLAVLNEEGWLTNLRTACAGAITARLLSKVKSAALGIIGAGTQAAWQARVTLAVNKNFTRVLIWNRTPNRAKLLQQELNRLYPRVSIALAESVSELVAQSDTLISATPARNPIVKANMVRKGMTLISVGSDMPEKCEFEPALYKIADKIIVDSLQSNILLGCVKRSLEQKAINIKRIANELGTLLQRKAKARRSDEEIIVASLVGLGAQDTYIADLAYQVLSRAARNCKIPAITKLKSEMNKMK